ncbi:hypothetical protein [Immundisolibacter sp.]
MPYTAFDPAKPDAATQNGTQFAQATRDNLKAVRDAVIMGGGFYGWGLNASGGVCTASISGTTMTVTAIASGTLAVGQTISGTGVASGTTITALGTGAGGIGTYTISASHSLSSRTITATNDPLQPTGLSYSKSTERIRAALTWGTSGGEAGNVTVAHYSYSSDSGASYDSIGVNTITYDGNGNVTGTTWS